MIYKGFEIEVKSNGNNKEYPYLGVGKKDGVVVIEKRGYNEQQAIDLVEADINFTLGVQELKKNQDK